MSNYTAQSDGILYWPFQLNCSVWWNTLQTCSTQLPCLMEYYTHLINSTALSDEILYSPVQLNCPVRWSTLLVCSTQLSCVMVYLTDLFKFYCPVCWNTWLTCSVPLPCLIEYFTHLFNSTALTADEQMTKTIGWPDFDSVFKSLLHFGRIVLKYEGAVWSISLLG